MTNTVHTAVKQITLYRICHQSDAEFMSVICMADWHQV